MAAVTNRARAPRVLALANGCQATLAPGQTEDLDLAADHPVHAAWAAAGDIEIEAAPQAVPAEEDAEPCPDPASHPSETLGLQAPRSRQRKS